MFACDYCRTKYTPAQAKSMLVEGTVQVDRSNEIGNLISLAKAALDHGNPGEAYGYANRALEIDAKLSQAWQYKGEAAGWLSDGRSIRNSEMIGAFESAIDLTTDDQRDGLRQHCADVMNRVAVAVHEAALTDLEAFAKVEGTWKEHTALCAQIIWTLQYSSYWGGGRYPLESIVALGSRLLNGFDYENFQGVKMWHHLTSDEEAYFRSQLNQAVEEIQKTDPAYAAPEIVKGGGHWVRGIG